jgi:hypothetical protein
LSYPDGFHCQRVDYIPSGAGEGWMYDTFASFSLPPSYTGSSGASASAPFDGGGAFPATGAAFQLGDVEIPVQASPESRFPLRPSNFSVRPAGATAGLIA